VQFKTITSAGMDILVKALAASNPTTEK
jgi:hypothetical protein